MFKAGNIGGAICPVSITDRYFNNFKIEFIGAENQVKISEWIKIPEKFAVRNQALIIFFENYFSSAQGIFKGLFEQPGKSPAEEFVSQANSKSA